MILSMEKKDLSKEFALRLRDALIKAGFSSKRSTSGIDIHKLTEITGYSEQICRKYLRGEAIPEPKKIIEISIRLNVSPGWLLFGHANRIANENCDEITIDKRLLDYMFIKVGEMYSDNSQISNFLSELVNDLNKINANFEQSQKIIDLALSSFCQFSLA